MDDYVLQTMTFVPIVNVAVLLLALHIKPCGAGVEQAITLLNVSCQ